MEKIQTDWSQPTDADAVELAFPAHGVSRMPDYEDIPEEFRNRNWRRGGDGAAKWLDFQSEWFAKGFAFARLTPRDDVSPFVASNHLKAIQGSFEPKHEHKVAGVAYLASLWFDDVVPIEDVEKNRPAWSRWYLNSLDGHGIVKGKYGDKCKCGASIISEGAVVEHANAISEEMVEKYGD